VLKENQVVGGGLRSSAKCPRCGSLDRERLVYLYLRNKTNVFKEDLRILHVAPERNLLRVLFESSNIDYLSADIDSPLAMVKIDLTDILFEDDSFDVIICNHVLEHIQDDRKAMSELFRVLKPGGWAILQVPIAMSLEKTIEDPTVIDSAERERLFGQSDHVRIYARDYKWRLEGVGFGVEVYDFTKEQGEAVSDEYGLIKDESLYVCSKPEREDL
jgi:SAM-dependent methyltransferase